MSNNWSPEFTSNSQGTREYYQDRDPVYPEGQMSIRTEGNGKFYASVMTWFAVSFLAAFIGAVFVGPIVPNALMMPLYVVSFIALLASGFLQRINGMSQILSIVIPFILGVILYPTIALYVSSGAASAVILSLIGTIVIFAASAIAGWVFKKDISSMMPILFGVLLGVIAISFLNAFFFKLAWLAVIVSVVVIVIMVFYIYATMQRVRHGGYGAHASSYSLQLFVDIYNIFVSLLQIFGMFSRD